MKKHHLVSWLVLSVTILATSLQTIAQENNSLLFKVSGNGLKKPSYIFGTIHMIPKEKYLFRESWEKALKECKILTTEADIDVPLGKKLELAKKMMLPKDESIKNYMTEDEYNQVKTFFVDSLKINEGKFNSYTKLKPLYMMSMVLVEQLNSNNIKTVSYESNIAELAKKNKLDFKYLETIEYQASMFDSISLKKQVEMAFLDKAQSYKTTYKDFNVLLESYLSANVDKLYQQSQKNSQFGELENKLINNRNQNWIPIIETSIKENPTFFAVGALHLGGEKGVLELLKKKGYTITPVE